MGASAYEILVLPIFWATLGSLACGAIYLGMLRMISAIGERILGRIDRGEARDGAGRVARDARPRRAIRLGPNA
ncbi:hypothetical protein OJF2_35000 [Aquisphaera giovannonii]|uniref:Uncharacterized protein n=1 Tax=Aquisphaera giovannonii TaxID=406548 RepID=A0A5B9W4B9_9BACT|nr:hypothetical protein [Aquisphaera giovannonii]QEH34955.1 hypothetical protein OJF2_35000 [Aquisphaera giovannonii]